jgi:integrase
MVTRGMIPHDVVAGVGIRGQSRYDQPVRVPTEAEIRELLSAADRLANSKNLKIQKTWRRYRPMLYLATDTGMRPQEYVVVPRQNISAKGVEVDRALERGGNSISVTKTPAGRRLIDLSPHVLDMIDHYVRTYAAKSPHNLAFPTASGQWLSTENWARRGFRAACIEAGLFEEVRRSGETFERPTLKPYDLRHFFASMLIDQRRSLKRIQYLMGHRDIQTTLNVYGHLIERVEIDEHAKKGLLSSMDERSCGESVARPQ